MSEVNSPKPKKPGQVLAVQIILWIQFGFGLCGGILGAMGSAALSGSQKALDDAGLTKSDASFLMIVSIIALIFALCAGFLALNVPKRKKWVQTGGIVLAGLAILNGIINIVIQSNPIQFAGFILPVLIIVMLLSQPAKEWFTE